MTGDVLAPSAMPQPVQAVRAEIELGQERERPSRGTTDER